MIFALACLLLLPPNDPPTIQVTIGLEQPEHHWIKVEMLFPVMDTEQVRLLMPNWIPGSYLIRDFPKHIQDFQAMTEAGTPLAWARKSKDQWEVKLEKNQRLKVTYRVYANEFTVRTSYLDAFGATLNPSSLILYVQGNKHLPYELAIQPFQKWISQSGLSAIGKNRYRAENYDQLVDSPILVGELQQHEFQVNGVPHFWILTGEINLDIAGAVKDLSRICEETVKIFGSQPFDRFYFLHQFRLDEPYGGGGLEHANNTLIQVNSDNFRTKEKWERLMSLLAHEYFHAWNVKSIKDRNLGPFNYQEEVYTQLLWLHEGFTSYYDELLLVRAGLKDDKAILEKLAKDIKAYNERPGADVQSLKDASLNAWIHYYQRSENEANTAISYYDVGALAGLCLDLIIRNKTKNKASLDDFMRHLFQDYALKGDTIDRDIVARVLAYVVGEAGTEFLTNFIEKPNRLPLVQCLSYAGLEMVVEGEDQDSDHETAYRPNPEVDLGIEVQETNAGIEVHDVRRGGAGWKAGLDFGDEILAVNGKRTKSGTWDSALAWFLPGDRAELLVSRNRSIVKIQVTFDGKAKPIKLESKKNPTELQKSIYNALFRPSQKEAEASGQPSEGKESTPQ